MPDRPTVSESPSAPSTVHRDEKKLIEACIKGDEGSWESFIHQYGRLIRFVVARIYRDRQEGFFEKADIESHVYEKLIEDGYRRLRLWKGNSKFSTYLVQVARNLSIDLLVKHNRDGRLDRSGEIPAWLSDDEAFGRDDISEARLEALEKAMDDLPPKQAVIIRMRLEGKSLRQIAMILDRPVGTVSVENSRALEKLRQILREPPPDTATPNKTQGT